MRRLGIIIVLLSFAANLFASKVELQDAERYAINAYYQKVNLYHENVSLNKIKIVETFTIQKNDEAVYYIFNMENYGFIIISAEDALNPVQAYNFDRFYDPEVTVDNFSGWLDGRAGAVVYARENNMAASQEVMAKWQALLDVNNLTLTDGGKSIEPLLTSLWNQDWPENYYMPLDPDGPGGRCYVGCVATAMSMIMHYWRYPLQGTGQKTHSYGGYPAITVNYGNTTYDWDAMVDNTGSVINLPMAEIGMHAAVSVNMEWSPDGSGAYSSDVPAAMENYFNFNPTCFFVDNQGVPWSSWKGYIENELEVNCPVYYSGYNSDNAGHAFVCDGFNSDDMYHFNFGWSGSGNGWYDITSPSGYEWYYGQGIVRLLYPDDDNYPYGCAPGYERNTLVGSFEDGSGPMENYDESAYGTWLINPQTAFDSVEQVTLTFVTMDTDPNDIITVYDGPTTSDPVLGTFSGDVVPATLTASSNQMLISFEANGDAITGTGWKAEYNSLQPDYCSSSPVELTEAVGILNDGSGDFHYKNNTNCMWMIKPDWASGVTLTFSAFDTEATEDYLQVYDASNNQLLGEFSGTTIPDPIYVESGELFLIWKTNGVIQSTGWEASWEADNVGVGEELANIRNLLVYPNPARESLSLSFSSQENQTYTVKLLKVTGELVYQESTGFISGTYNTTIKLGDFAKGIYFLNITGESGTINRKVMVK